MIRYSDVIATTIDGVLKPLGGASVLVRVSATSEMATVFDALGAPAQNPVTADSLGRIAFYAPTGIYDLTVSHTSITAFTLPGVKIGDGTIHVADFGAISDGITDTAEELQTAIDYAGSLASTDWLDPGASNIVVDLDGGSYLVGAPLTVPSRVKLQNGQLIADTSADWGDDGSGKPTRAVVELSLAATRATEIYGITIICGHAANGILIDVGGGAFNRITKNIISGAGEVGIHVKSAAGTYIENNVITEWFMGEEEFNSDESFVATGIRLDDSDQKIFRNTCRWSRCNLQINKGTALVEGNHFYNGRPSSVGAGVRYRPINIECYGWGNLFTGNYIDNGEVRLYNTNQVFDGNRHADGGGSNLEALYCLYASVVDDKVNWLRICNGMLTLNQQTDVDGSQYIKLIEEGGYSFVDRQSSLLLRGTAADPNISGNTHLFVRMGVLSRRVAEFRGQMPTALVTAESSTTTDNENLPGFGAHGDHAVISANNSNHVFVSPEGYVGINGTETAYKLGVYGGVNTLVKLENTSTVGTAQLDLVGARTVLTEEVGALRILDKTYGVRAAFSGRTNPDATTGGLAVISAATSGTLTARWAVDQTGALRPWTNNAVDIGATGQRVKDLYLVNSPNVSSDERTKTDVADSTLGLEFIEELRPVTYKIIESANATVPGEPITETVEVQVTRNEEYESIEIVDGQAVLSIKVREVPVFDSLPVVDAEGNPVYVLDENGEPTEVQRTYLAPRMTTITREVPTLEPDVLAGQRYHAGFIAQEVKQALDTLEIASFAGWGLADPNDEESMQFLRYEEFIAPIVKAIQELVDRVTALEGAP